jgi:membrane protease YdiL (CAAX protease family)
MEKIEQSKLIILVTSIEIVVIVLAVVLGFIFQINLFNKFSFNIDLMLLSLYGTAGLIAINYISVFVLSRYIGFFKNLKIAYDEVSIIVADVNTPGIIIIALLSGFAEELFFRGIVQTGLGITIASIIFGLVHIGNKKTIYYGVYAIFIGFYLGFFMLYTESLWVPIIIHIINNVLAIPFMKKNYNKLMNQQETSADIEG